MARTEHTIEVDAAASDVMEQAFDDAHQRQFGYRGDAPLFVDRAVVEAVFAGSPPESRPTRHPADPAPTCGAVPVFCGGAWVDAPVLKRDILPCGHSLAGPALIVDEGSTTMVEPGWRATVDALGNLILDRVAARSRDVVATAVDPVRLAVFSGLFMSVAEEMGVALQRSAASVNIRERLDFSCAVFDADGNLIANAPHIPVHLGSMGDSIRTVIARRGNRADGRGFRRGDAYALNDPYNGGTHLPDITVIMPVFADRHAAAPAWFVAARGHHADIGGITPGSMPPESRSIDEEGILLDDVLLVDEGRFLGDAMRERLAAGPHPARSIDQNLADMAAQVAACARGAAGLGRLAREYGAEAVSAYMGHVQDYADAAVRRLIGTLKDGAFTYDMDDGAQVSVAVHVDRVRRTLSIDFAGSSFQQPTNFNAPQAIVRAAVLYVLRLLLKDGTVPLNDGCLRAVEIRVPDGTMLSPRYPAAVVAGNVEVSQVVTDALLGALGAMAASQGTMNNLTFGNADHQYYETIAGGAGAGETFPGESAIQTHMTNSRLTDPELLETRFPVMVDAFSIRRGSGGTGGHAGGDGVTRRLRFLEPMTACVLANRRRVPPFGLSGGAPGATGSNRVERHDGAEEQLGSTARVEMSPGDAMVIETPGGGGFGEIS